MCMYAKLTLPCFTSSSSSTQGVKSCKTIILLSGDRPFSFSMPTRTRVSIEALPVIRPIPGGLIVSLSSAVEKKMEKIVWPNMHTRHAPLLLIQRIRWKMTSRRDTSCCTVDTHNFLFFSRTWEDKKISVVTVKMYLASSPLHVLKKTNSQLFFPVLTVCNSLKRVKSRKNLLDVGSNFSNTSHYDFFFWMFISVVAYCY